MTDASLRPAEAMPGRPPVKGDTDDSAKRRQIIDGARTVFLADGFDGASMNEIARVAGVSKGTLYVYFASKDELFAALIREDKRACRLSNCASLRSDDTDLPTDAAAISAWRFSILMLRPTSISHLRTVVAVAGKVPEHRPGLLRSRSGIRHETAGPILRQAGGSRRSSRDRGYRGGGRANSPRLCKAPHHAARHPRRSAERPTDARRLAAHVIKVVDMFLKVVRAAERLTALARPPLSGGRPQVSVIACAPSRRRRRPGSRTSAAAPS